MPTTLNVPPFPPLAFDSYAWTGVVRLRAWAGFQSSGGPYASMNSARESDGLVDLRVHVPGDDPVPPSAEQLAAFALLLEEQNLVIDSVLSAILQRYPAWRDEYLDDMAEDDEDDEDALALLPEITRPEELCPLIGLAFVHILAEAKDGRAYIGFEFGCEWETEHGLGIMTHGDTVLEVGHAVSAFRLR
jgi:hypothetical protein